MNKYYVADENMLLYDFASQGRPDLLGCLASSILRGGPSERGGLMFHKTWMKNLRPATEADFDTFNVQLPPDFTTNDSNS